MRILLVCALFLPAILAAPLSLSGSVGEHGINFAADTNVTIRNGDSFNFRAGALTEIDFSLFHYATFTMIEVSGSGTAQGGGSASASGIMALAYSQDPANIGLVSLTPGVPPSAFLSYWEVAGSWPALTGNVGTISAAGSGSIVGTVYAKVEEVNAQNVAVKVLNLNTVQWDLTTSNNSTAAAKLYIAKNTATGGSGEKVSVYFVMSEVVGVLNIGGATLTPKSMEVIFELSDWVYTNPSNRLKLTFYTVTAVGKVEGSASATFYDDAIIAGSGPSQAYFRAALTAAVDGQQVDVTATITKDDQTAFSGFNNLIVQQASAVGSASGSVDYAKVEVLFPAGAQKITYDPAYGFEAPNSAAKMGSLLALVAAFVALFQLL